LGRKAREIHGRVPTYLTVHGQIGSYHGQPASHGLYQRMRKSLGIGGGYVDIARPENMLQKVIGNGPEFDDLIRNPKTSD